MRLPGILLAVALASTAAVADELELTSGRKYQGLLVSRTDQAITFKIFYPSGATAVMEFPASAVKSLDVTGRAPEVKAPPDTTPPATTPPATTPPATTPPATTPPPPAATSPPQPKVTPQAEIDAAIDAAGKSKPDWWDSVTLNYPPTLDLADTRKVTGHQPNVKMGTYKWSVIDPNPNRWKEGIKLFHHALTARKDDPPRLSGAMNTLGEMYRNYLQDWARSAFWYRKAMEVSSPPQAHGVVGLAECCWKLGSKPMAVALLNKHGLGGQLLHPDAIMLWLKMGEPRKAMELAEGLARFRPAEAYLLAGSICQHEGKFPEAVRYYEKVLALPAKDSRRQQDWARAYMESVKQYAALDVSRIPDGTYAAESTGFRGPVRVEVAVAAGKIASVKVISHKEDAYFYARAMAAVPEAIIRAQHVKGVDATTGATRTSQAILNATAAALVEGMKK